MKLSDMPAKPPKIMIWGRPATYKTPFITSFGEGLHFIDIDNGMRSSQTIQDRWTLDRQKVEVEPCWETDPGKAQAWLKFKTILSNINIQITQGTYKHKVLAVDSFTALAEACLRWVMGNSGLLKGDMLSQEGTMQQAHWGVAIAEITRVFMYLRAFPIPVVTVLHDKTAKIGKGADMYEEDRLNIFGSNLPNALIGQFDEVHKMKLVVVAGGKTQAVLQTLADAHTVARSRNGIPNLFDANLGFREYLRLMGYPTPTSVSTPQAKS